MSASHARKISAYPCHKYFCLFKAYVDKKEVSDSYGVETMFREFFDKLPEKEQQSLMEHYKKIKKQKS